MEYIIRLEYLLVVGHYQNVCIPIFLLHFDCCTRCEEHFYTNNKLLVASLLRFIFWLMIDHMLVVKVLFASDNTAGAIQLERIVKCGCCTER